VVDVGDDRKIPDAGQTHRFSLTRCVVRPFGLSARRR
jgi:hypothetical protein